MVMMIICEHDGTVCPRAIHSFNDRVTSCELYEAKDSKHEFLFERDVIRDKVLAEAVNFFKRKKPIKKARKFRVKSEKRLLWEGRIWVLFLALIFWLLTRGRAYSGLLV